MNERLQHATDDVRRDIARIRKGQPVLTMAQRTRIQERVRGYMRDVARANLEPAEEAFLRGSDQFRRLLAVAGWPMHRVLGPARVR